MQNSSLLDLYIVQTINQGNPFTFHAQNNNKQHNMNDDKWIHHTKQPPRLSLREYGGPLTPINEIPQSSSSLIYTKHRLSSSLTLPTTYTITQHEKNENERKNDVSRRRHSLPSSVNNETYDTMNLLLVDFPHNEISRQQQRRSLLLVDFPHNNNKTRDYDDDDDDLTIATNKNGCCNTDEKNDETTHHVNTTTTACCDEYGRCIKHPNVQLRSKILFFWDRVLLTACPDCCMEELTRLYENYSTTGNKNEDEDDDNDSNSSITTIQESSDYYD